MIGYYVIIIYVMIWCRIIVCLFVLYLLEKLRNIIFRGVLKKRKVKIMDFWKLCKLLFFLSFGIEGLVLISFFGILYKVLWVVL